MEIIIVIVIIFVLYILFSSGNSTSSMSPTSSTRSDYTNRTTKSYSQNNSKEFKSAAPESAQSIRSKIKRAISNDNDVKIEYRKYDGTSSNRRLSDISYNNEFEMEGYNNDHIKGWCHLRSEERTFKIDRIKSIEILA